MRCKNCGWENPDNSVRCEKCNAPLTGSMGSNHSEAREPRVDGNPLKKTVRESNNINPIHENGLKKCPSCGYLYNSEIAVCPNCGKSEMQEAQHNENKPQNKTEDGMVICPFCHETVPSKFNFCANCGQPFGKHTINPWAKPQNAEKQCSLTPIPWEGEENCGQSQKYAGSSIVLNRANTDSCNNSITSKEQALLSFENDAWYIEDKSQQQTTYLHVGRKMQIEDGDIIILGNRRFTFKG